MSRTARLLVGVVFGVALLAGCQGGTQDGASPTTSAHHPHPGFNQVAKDGDLAFTVTGLQCEPPGTVQGIDRVRPGRQSCTVAMTVVNDGTSFQTFAVSSQKAIDASGRTLRADLSSSIFTGENNQRMSNQLASGDSAITAVPFVLASSDRIKQVELHESAFSRGVIVDVSRPPPPPPPSTTTTATTLPTALHVGDTATLNGVGGYQAAAVTLDRVIDNPSVPIPPSTITTSAASQLYSLDFGVVNTGSDALVNDNQRDDANLEVYIITSDGGSFPGVVPVSIPGCPAAPPFRIEPGTTTWWCPVFQIPASATVVFAYVLSGMGYGSWHIP